MPLNAIPPTALAPMMILSQGLIGAQEGGENSIRLKSPWEALRWVPSCKLTSPSIAAKGHIQDHVHVPSTRDKDFSRTVSWKKRLGLRKHAVCVAEILSFSKMRGMNANRPAQTDVQMSTLRMGPPHTTMISLCATSWDTPSSQAQRTYCVTLSAPLCQW